MSEFLNFAGEHPILTFFLAAIIGEVIIRVFRGYPPKEYYED